LTRFLSGYFDTTTGPKRDSDSYTKIVDALDLAPSELLFVSDMAAEVDAAHEAGLQALLIDRAGGPADIHSLAEVLP
ncbi:hypothetical protein, partial [Staphylococcus aureus]